MRAVDQSICSPTVCRLLLAEVGTPFRLALSLEDDFPAADFRHAPSGYSLPVIPVPDPQLLRHRPGIVVLPSRSKAETAPPNRRHTDHSSDTTLT